MWNVWDKLLVMIFLNIILVLLFSPVTFLMRNCVSSYTPQLLFRRGGVFRPEVSVCPLKLIQKASVFLIPIFEQLWSCMLCAACTLKKWSISSTNASVKYLDSLCCVKFLSTSSWWIDLFSVVLCCCLVCSVSYPFSKSHTFPGFPLLMIVVSPTWCIHYWLRIKC